MRTNKIYEEDRTNITSADSWNCKYNLAQNPNIVASKKPGWHKIGEVKTSFKMESESIAVHGADEFK